MSDIKKDLLPLILVLLSAIGGFFIGKKQLMVPEKVEIKSVAPQVSVIKIDLLKDDLLQIELSENTRLLWSDSKNSAEGVGKHVVPLGQIETENSKKLAEFTYLGNAKTKKFYPALSYPARGTEIRYRRFFDTKEAAISAGFIASKLVK